MKVAGYDHYSYTWEYTMTTSSPLSDEEIAAVSDGLLDGEQHVPSSVLKAFTTEPYADV